VGWLTSLVPVRLELGGAKTATELLSQVRGRLEALPRSGIGFGLLRYLSHDSAIRERLRALPEPEVAFNYLGQLDNVFGEGLFRNAREATGRWHGARCARPYLFNIDASVLEGQLQVGWTYSRHRHERATTERLVRRYIQALRELIANR
jgi:non-ribosomal peptide synthase protein (TIGR01720 family)